MRVRHVRGQGACRWNITERCNPSAHETWLQRARLQPGGTLLPRALTAPQISILPNLPCWFLSAPSDFMQLPSAHRLGHVDRRCAVIRAGVSDGNMDCRPVAAMGQEPYETRGREPKGEFYRQHGWVPLLLCYLTLYPQGLTWRHAQ